MNRKSRNIKSMLAWILTASMILTNVSYVKADDVTVGDYETEVVGETISEKDALTESVSQGWITNEEALEEDMPSEDASAWEIPHGSMTDENVTTGDIPEKVSIGDMQEDFKPLADEVTILYSGEKSGIKWEIDSEGVLTISGEQISGSENPITESNAEWLEVEYKMVIKKAIIMAKNVQSTKYWFYNCRNLTSVDTSSFDTSKVTDMSFMFYGCVNLTNLDVASFDTSKVTNMQDMFSMCWNLSYLDVSHFDTSNVTDMSGMFDHCYNLTNLDVSSFDTSEVTNMRAMFLGCYSLTNLDVSGFNTSKVTDMIWMFGYCSSLTSLDVSGFDTSKTYYISSMFDECDSLVQIKTFANLYREVNLPKSMKDADGNEYTTCPQFLSQGIWLYADTSTSHYSGEVSGIKWEINSDGVLTISGEQVEKSANPITRNPNGSYSGEWLTYKDSIKKIIITAKNVQSTSGWFYQCSNVTSLDVSNFDTSSVTDMSYMFSKCSKLTSLNLSGFNTSKVTDMSYMFDSCETLTSLNLSGFDTSKVTDMSHMFYVCNILTSLNLSDFNTSKVTDMSYMFSGCWRLTSLNISNFNTSKVRNMINMFSFCYDLTSLNVSNFDTSNVWDMDFMFDNCTVLSTLDVSGFVTSNVRGMGYMFRGCESLTTLDVSHFNTSNVSIMDRMFYDCSSLTTLDVSNFKTSNVSSMYCMFNGCSSLSSLDVSNFDISNVTEMSGMFSWCDSLTQIKTFANLKLQVDLPTLMYDEYGNEYSIFPQNFSQGIWLYTEKPTNPTPAPSGIQSGVIWNIDAKGVLTISGQKIADTPTITPDWLQYKDFIFKVIIDSKNIDSTNSWFEGCDKITEIDLSKFDTSKVTDMNQMFHGCSSLTNLDLSSFDTSNVTDMSNLFSGCSSLSTLDVSNFNISNVTNMDQMFDGCISLTQIKTFANLNHTVDLPKSMYDKDGNEYTTFPQNLSQGIWLYAEKPTSPSPSTPSGTQSGIKWNIDSKGVLTISGQKTADTPTITPDWLQYKDSIFKVSITAKNIDSTNSWFDGCNKITEIDLSKFDTSKVTDMNRMFYGCSSLTTLDVSGFDTANVTDMTDMFNGCTSIQQLQTFPNLKLIVPLPVTPMYDLEHVTYTVFPQGLSQSIRLYADESLIPSRNESFWAEIIDTDSFIYTGKAIKPAINVYYGDKLLTEKTDYTISYKNNTKANDATDTKTAPTITVKGKGNYNGAQTITFPIEPVDLSDENILASDLFLAVSNKAQKPIPTVTWQGKKLSNKKDYTLSYFNAQGIQIDSCEDVGNYTLRLTGTGNFTGTKDVPLIITNCTLISKAKVKAIPKQNYTGEEINPEVTVTIGKTPLELNQDYTVDYYNNIDAGKATAVITGMGDYAGTKTVTFQIVGTPVTKATVTSITEKVYNGQAQTQDGNQMSVTLNGETLTEGKDYEVSYSKNIDAGTASLTIRGIGGYSGTLKKTFKIIPYDLADADQLIDGIPESLTVPYMKGGCTPSLTFTFDNSGISLELTAKKDYTVRYSNNKNVTVNVDGTANPDLNSKIPTITIKGKGNFKGTRTIYFDITPNILSDPDTSVTMTLADMPYSEKPGKYISKPVLTDANGKKLAAGTDYEKVITYALVDNLTQPETPLDNLSVPETGSIIRVTVTGKGNYTGTMEMTYRIAPKSFAKAKITVSPKVYTGEEITLESTDVTVKIGQDTLVNGKDYEIAADSYKNNVKKGTASVTIKGIGDYAGNKNVKYKITAKQLVWFWNLF